MFLLVFIHSIDKNVLSWIKNLKAIVTDFSILQINDLKNGTTQFLVKYYKLSDTQSTEIIKKIERLLFSSVSISRDIKETTLLRGVSNC